MLVTFLHHEQDSRRRLTRLMHRLTICERLSKVYQLPVLQETLAGFTTHYSAHDVANLIEAANRAATAERRKINTMTIFRIRTGQGKNPLGT